MAERGLDRSPGLHSPLGNLLTTLIFRSRSKRGFSRGFGFSELKTRVHRASLFVPANIIVRGTIITSRQQAGQGIAGWAATLLVTRASAKIDAR